MSSSSLRAYKAAISNTVSIEGNRIDRAYSAIASCYINCAKMAVDEVSEGSEQTEVELFLRGMILEAKSLFDKVFGFEKELKNIVLAEYPSLADLF